MLRLVYAFHVCAGEIEKEDHLAYALIEVMLLIHGWGRSVKRAPPYLHLSLSVLFGCFSFVQPSQPAVMAFIKAPGAVHGQPHLINAVQNMPQGADGPLQHGGVAHIKFIAGI